MMATLLVTVGAVCAVTAVLDLGVNGPYADWAPWGVGATLACFILSNFVG